jgi:osmotically-inducible protein OsmY
MVESNNDEERLARLEQMIEALQRESATVKTVAAKLIDIVQTSSAMAARHVLEERMNLLKRVMTAGLVGVVLVAGVAREASAAGQTATSGTVVVEDSTIQSRIAANLKHSTSLAPRDIDVDVFQGIVTLKGKVRTTTEKARAGRLAAGSGVTQVINRIEVDPKIDQSRIDAAGEKTKSGLTKAVDASVTAAKKTKEAVQTGLGKSEEGVGKAANKTSEAAGKVGDKLSDTSVTTRVKAGFADEKLLQDTAIDVDTTDHVVTLRGTVASNAAKARAGEIAGGIDGVTRVVNQIAVGGR